MSDWVKIKSDEMYALAAKAQGNGDRWPLAGHKLDEFTKALRLDDDAKFLESRAAALCTFIMRQKTDKQGGPQKYVISSSERVDLIRDVNNVLGLENGARINVDKVGDSAEKLANAIHAKFGKSATPFDDFIERMKKKRTATHLQGFDTLQPSRITLEGMNQDYHVASGYLVPCAPILVMRGNDASSQAEADAELQRRNEALIISRSFSFLMNAQPELGVKVTKAQIYSDLNKLAEMPEGTPDQCREKFGQFKLIAGEIMSRLETLGRVITQGNMEGTVIEYEELRNKAAIPPELRDQLKAEMAMRPKAIAQLRQEFREHLGKTTSLTKTKIAGVVRSFKPSEDLHKAFNEAPYKALMAHTIPEKMLDRLRMEYFEYCTLLTQEDMLPLLHGLLLTDKRIDTDGVLIDFIREISKPVVSASSQEDEAYVRGNIVEKIGYAMESIDQVYHQLHELLTKEPTAKLFREATKDYLAQQPKGSKVHDADSFLHEFELYANRCKVRTGIQGKDPAYADNFVKRDAFLSQVVGANGLLQSMRQTGRSAGNVEIQRMRDVLRKGLKLMEVTGYTRTPCDSHAPEPWIPNLSPEATPMEQYMASLLTPSELARATRKFEAADKIVELAADKAKEEGIEFDASSAQRERTKYLRDSFSSLGILRSDIRKLRNDVERRNPIAEAVARNLSWVSAAVSLGASDTDYPAEAQPEPAPSTPPAPARGR